MGRARQEAVVLAHLLSLRDALILAAEFSGDGHAIVALTQPNDRVGGFPGSEIKATAPSRLGD